MNHDKM